MHLPMTQAYELFAGHGLYIESDRTPSKYHFQLTIQLDRLHKCPRVELRALVGDAAPVISSDVIDPIMGLHRYQLNNLVNDLYLPQTYWHTFSSLALRLYRLYDESDALEIVVHGSFDTLDTAVIHRASVLMDEQAHFRHAFMTFNTEPVIHLLDEQGNIACIGSGAGLTLSTLDALAVLGDGLLKPFCAIEVEEDRLLQELENVANKVLNLTQCSCVVFNVFGTFVGCDQIANIIVDVQRLFPDRFLVVCLCGLRAHEASLLLDNEGCCYVTSFVDLVRVIQEKLS